MITGQQIFVIFRRGRGGHTLYILLQTEFHPLAILDSCGYVASKFFLVEVFWVGRLLKIG